MDMESDVKCIVLELMARTGGFLVIFFRIGAGKSVVV